jgi:hypothetical protein
MKKILAWIAVILLAVYVLVMVGYLLSKIFTDTYIMLMVLVFVGIPVAGLFGVKYLTRGD